jgi:hypothetical protein
MNDFELTSPRPDQTPDTAEPQTGSRVFDWGDLEEKTIQAIIDCPAGRRGLDLDSIIICTDGTWLTISAQSDGCGEDSAHIYLGTQRFDREPDALSDFLSPNQLLRAGLVNEAQYRFLENRAAEQKKKDNADRAARLRAEAAKLEGGVA